MLNELSGGQTMSCARFFRREGFSLIAIALVASAVTSMCSAPAVAHDQWADGSPIPAWVSTSRGSDALHAAGLGGSRAARGS